MEIEVTPEPTPDERAAIEAALRAAGEEARAPNPWWEAGLPADPSDEESG